MIKCVCNNISMDDIELIMSLKNLTYDDACKELDVGNQCGTCYDSEDNSKQESERS